MVLLFGKKKNILAAFVDKIDSFKSIIISSESPEKLREMLKNPGLRLIIFYAESFEGTLMDEYNSCRASFPDVQIWAIHNWSNSNTSKRLKDIGFDHVITFDDDLEQELEKYPQI